MGSKSSFNNFGVWESEETVETGFWGHGSLVLWVCWWSIHKLLLSTYVVKTADYFLVCSAGPQQIYSKPFSTSWYLWHSLLVDLICVWCRYMTCDFKLQSSFWFSFFLFSVLSCLRIPSFLSLKKRIPSFLEFCSSLNCFRTVIITVPSWSYCSVKTIDNFFLTQPGCYEQNSRWI